MSLPPRIFSRAWIVVPLLAFGFVVWTTQTRVERIEYVTNLPEWSVDPPTIDPSSPTGYANGRRQLIVPGHNNESYQWIIQTQLMLAAGEWRLRHVSYDNAPLGREVRLSSPYRWWLASVAWFDHMISGRSVALSLERAALWADPLLQLIALLGATLFTARHFGRLAAMITAGAFVALFPFADGFLPGAPDRQGLAQICALASVLPLLAGLRVGSANHAHTIAHQSVRDRASSKRRLFAMAGMAGGLGLWINMYQEWPVLAGLALGGFAAAWLIAPHPNEPTPPWRLWGLCGCVTSLLTYAWEFFPSHMELRFDTNHPVIAVAWWGAGELLHRAAELRLPAKAVQCRSASVGIVLAIVAVSTFPAALIWTGSPWLANDPLTARLTASDMGVTAPSLAAWLARDGWTLIALATVLPALAIAPAVWIVLREKFDRNQRIILAVGVGSALAAAIPAWIQLRNFVIFDSVILALIAVVIGTMPRSRRIPRGILAIASAIVLGCGLIILWPARFDPNHVILSEIEVHSLVERDLSHGLAMRTGPDIGVILAPPDLTTSMSFHASLRGLGTFFPENQDGVSAAIRIAGATSPDEALGLIRNRSVSHIIIPSWDPFLDEYARSASGMPERSFTAALRNWAPPGWVRAVPYSIPTVNGIETQSVVIFTVVDDQDNVAALSRAVEYFIEMGQLDSAASLVERLRRYPSNIDALVGLAQLATARGDVNSLEYVFSTLVPTIENGATRRLPWDRRVSLAIVLAQGKRPDLAHMEISKCLEQIDEARLRSLTTAGIFRLLLLAKATKLEFPEPRLHALALALLPPSLRTRLGN